MSENAQVYVGTTRRDGPAETVLEYSIRKSSSIGVDIHWMRAGEGMWKVGPTCEDGMWNIGREPCKPHSGLWATDFTCFRFAIPEVAGFQGRAIYLDVDMMVLGDIRELWERETLAPWTCLHEQRSDVSIIDCSAFAQSWWPRLETMRSGTLSRRRYHQIMLAHNAIQASLPAKWNCFDGQGYKEGKTRLVHFTNMHTQPWKPYQGWFRYNHKHQSPEVVRLWKEMLEEAGSLPRSQWPGCGKSSLAEVSPSSAATQP